MTRAALYIRVSTADQAQGDGTEEENRKTSLENQRKRCAAYCEAQGWQVAEVYEDAGVSGAKDDRPALVRLLADARHKDFDKVVFLKLDRFSRNTRNLLNTSHELDGLGVGIVSVMDNFDTSTPSGRLFFTLLGAIAEFERDLINERMTAGRLGRVRNGKVQTPIVPFGFRYIKETGKLEPDENAPIVRNIFAWAAAGEGIQKIARKLEALGVTPPDPTKAGRKNATSWNPTSVGVILRARRYTGEATYSGIPMKIPQLVTTQVFDAVQEAMDTRKTPKGRASYDYLLRGLVRCRHCRSAYFARTYPSKDGGIAAQWYCCLTRSRDGKKAGHEGIKFRWRVEHLDAIVEDAIYRIYNSPEQYLADKEAWVKQTRERLDEVDDTLRRLRKRGADLEGQRLQILNLMERGAYRTAAEGDERLAAVVTQLHETEEQLAQLEGAAQENASLKDLVDWLGSLPKSGPLTFTDDDGAELPFEALHPEVKREMITRLVSTIWIEDDGSITLEGPGGLETQVRDGSLAVATGNTTAR